MNFEIVEDLRTFVKVSKNTSCLDTQHERTPGCKKALLHIFLLHHWEVDLYVIEWKTTASPAGIVFFAVFSVAKLFCNDFTDDTHCYMRTAHEKRIILSLMHFRPDKVGISIFL